jgi:carbamoyl-phosphate synthase small subunit
MVATNAHIGNYGVNENEVESDGIKISGLVCKNFSFNHSRADSSESLEDYFIKQNLICISDVDRALVSYIRDNGMNAVICTDGFYRLVKASLADVPDMKELASKFPQRNHIYGDEHGTHRIAVLDLGIKEIFFAILLKEIAI